jgi:hypothetical protein
VLADVFASLRGATNAAAVLEEATQIQAHLAAQDVDSGKIVAALTPPPDA